MKKASRKKTPKAKVKKAVKAPVKKPKAKTVKKSKTPVKKAKKAPIKKAVPKKAQAKKTPAKKKAVKSVQVKGNAKSNFLKVIDDSLAMIQKIKDKGDHSQKNINQEQKRMFATDDPNEKLIHFFQIEGLKIDSFAKVQPDFEALSALLNKAYAFATQIGGIIKDDFLNICQDLAKGINLDLMQKDFEKLKRDLMK